MLILKKWNFSTKTEQQPRETGSGTSISITPISILNRSLDITSKDKITASTFIIIDQLRYLGHRLRKYDQQ